MNGQLQGSGPRMSGGVFTSMEAEQKKEELFRSLLPMIKNGMIEAFRNK